MQLISNPKGLYFPNGYTAGTTERVTGYFSDTCCRPKLQITATDRVGNRRTYTADAYCKLAYNTILKLHKVCTTF